MLFSVNSTIARQNQQFAQNYTFTPGLFKPCLWIGETLGSRSFWALVNRNLKNLLWSFRQLRLKIIIHFWHTWPPCDFPAGNCMFKVNNTNTRTRCEIYSKLTIKIPERRQWRRSGIFIVNFEHISHLLLVFLLLNLSM